jgi:hypothetical protein
MGEGQGTLQGQAMGKTGKGIAIVQEVRDMKI